MTQWLTHCLACSQSCIIVTTAPISLQRRMSPCTATYTRPSVVPACQFQQLMLASNLAAIKEACGAQCSGLLLHRLPALLLLHMTIHCTSLPVTEKSQKSYINELGCRSMFVSLFCNFCLPFGCPNARRDGKVKETGFESSERILQPQYVKYPQQFMQI